MSSRILRQRSRYTDNVKYKSIQTRQCRMTQGWLAWPWSEHLNHQHKMAPSDDRRISEVLHAHCRRPRVACRGRGDSVPNTGRGSIFLSGSARTF